MIEFYYNKPIEFEKISNCFKESFAVELNQPYWDWRFKMNPNDNKIFISYILDEGILAAYYAVSPCKLLIEGKEYKAALSNMTMTHPSHQGKGYFKKIALELFNQLKEDGYVGVFGYANANSHYGFRKYLGWKDLSALNIISLKPDSLRKPLIKELDNIKFSITPVNENLLETASKMSFATSKISIVRNFSHLKWRFSEIPFPKYFALRADIAKKNEAILIIKYYQNEIDLMEFFYNPESNHDRFDLFGACIKQLIESENKQLNIWSNVHGDEHLYLEKIGFNETIFNTYFGFIPFGENKDLLVYNNWHYRFCDSDVF